MTLLSVLLSIAVGVVCGVFICHLIAQAAKRKVLAEEEEWLRRYRKR